MNLPRQTFDSPIPQGDLVRVKQLIENGVDPNLGDYDARTALHLAACTNQESIVEFLLAKKADVNARDRWCGTPLQDAITQGHMMLASLIRSKVCHAPQMLMVTRCFEGESMLSSLICSYGVQ